MTATEDRLLDLIVRRWPGGGYVVNLSWRKGGYPAGKWFSNVGSGYWFPERESAVAAVWIACGVEDRT